MYHLVYTSHATAPFSQADLLHLLVQSRTHNAEKSITGMLLYLEGKFIQVLEGRKNEVTKRYDKIRNDQRHKRVTTVVEGNSPSRVFVNWSMGFKTLSNVEFEKVTGFKDIDVYFEHGEKIEDGHLLLVLLKLFYEKNIVDYSEQ